MKFTGERFIPNNSDKRIENDHMERYKFVLMKLNNNKKVLDIACGEGYGSNFLSKNHNVVGVDISDEAVNWAKSKYACNNLKFEQGDATKYGKKDQFDVIVSFETIEHVSAYKDVIKNFYKLLKSDGMLYISSPNRMVTSPGAKKLLDKPKNKYHTQEFLPNELSELLVESGFKIKDIYGQRYFYYSKNTIINKVINKILRPAYISSPSVSLLRKYLQPRYFIIEAIRD
jgi:O-antigen biosynthesis protein